MYNESIRPSAVLARPTADTAPPAVSLRSGAGLWLVIVAAAYTVTMLLVVAPHAPLGADESLYASEVNPRTPALHFTAPRARGVTYLIAPVVRVADSTVALRAYLAIIAGLLLIVAYWPWLRVFRRQSVVPVAALLFCGLWTALYYGASDMPNIWVAFGAVAGVGWFVQYGQTRRPGALVGVAAALAVTALMRPSDAVWIALPMGVALLVGRGWRRPAGCLAVVGGIAAGLAQWVVEAYQRFGGPTERLHQASVIQGGIGWHPTGIGYELRALAGPLLCRPCRVDPTMNHPRPWLFAAWWLAIPILVVAGLVVARHERALTAMLLPAASGITIGLSYLLTVDYAAPRFLLPSYALFALPIAGLLTWLPAATVPRLRPTVIGLLALAVIAQLGGQATVLVHMATRTAPTERIATALERQGIHSPCVLAGVHRAQVGYRIGCDTTATAKLAGYAVHSSVAYLTRRSRAPTRFAHWHRTRIGDLASGPWYAYTPNRSVLSSRLAPLTEHQPDGSRSARANPPPATPSPLPSR